MMKIKGKIKKLFCALLAAVLLFCAFPQRAYALSGIDMSRLKLTNDIGHTVIFEFGNIKMKGKLTRQTPMTNEELQKLIDKVLKEMGLTELELKEMHQALEKAERAEQITPEEIQQFVDDLKTMLGLGGLGGVGEALSLLDVLLSGGDVAGHIGGAAADQLKDAAKDVGLELVDKNVLEGTKDALGGASSILDIINALDVLERAWLNDREKWSNREAISDLKAELNEFYDKLQKEIDKYKKDKSEESFWQIDFNHASAQRQNFTFFSVDANSQIWTLDMLLKQTESTGDFSFDSKNAVGSAAGTYEGRYTLKIDSDLIGFASRPQDAAKQIGIHRGIFAELEQFASMQNDTGAANARFDLETAGRGNARNERVISGACSVYILPSGEIQMNFEEGSDEIYNEFNGIQFKLHHTIISTQTNARIDNIQWANIKAMPNEKIVYIDYLHSASYINGQDVATIPGAITYSDEFEITQYNGPENGGWDASDIWTPWDDPMKTIRIVK